LFLIKKLF